MIVDPATVIDVLDKVGEALLSTLIGTLAKDVSDEVKARLHSDPTKKAIKQAFGSAIENYKREKFRTVLAEPLLEKNTFLLQPEVLQELKQLVRFDRKPNAQLIGDRWKQAMKNPPSGCNFTSEAAYLLDCLRKELQNNELFRPIFLAKSADAIADNTATVAQHSAISAQSLTRIEAQLARLDAQATQTVTQLVSFQALMTTHLGDLLRVFVGAPLRDQIRDYTWIIEEKTRDFVGRQHIFHAVKHFTETQQSGYFFIRGDPGIGKSALAAQMVKENGYIHHFNIRSMGINTAEKFLKNICAQLIACYHLQYTSLPPEVTRDGGFLVQLLEEASDRLKPTEKVIIVVDALDEVDVPDERSGGNPLYLPPTLPRGVFMIVTMRRTPLPYVECERDKFDIGQASKENEADIHTYIERAVEKPGIQQYIADKNDTNESFIRRLQEKSQGNFMYLRYVLHDIEKGKYADRDLGDLPEGLEGYYDDHWKRMGMTARPLPRNKIKIVYVLAALLQPASRHKMAAFTKEDELTVQEVLDEWDQFLHRLIVEEEIRYSIYHTSFREFLHRKDIVQAAGVEMPGIYKLITSDLRSQLYGDK